jgi:putative membrane protein
MATGTASKTSTGSTGGVVSTLNAADKDFFVKAAQANSIALALSKSVVDQTTNPNVRDLANRIIADHNNMNQELEELALRKGIALPTAAVAPALPNVDVDRAYVQRMLSDDQKAINEFGSAVVTDPDLRAWASKTLDVLRGEHQRLLNRATM